jgi:hypothetical protein
MVLLDALGVLVTDALGVVLSALDLISVTRTFLTVDKPLSVLSVNRPLNTLVIDKPTSQLTLNL